MQITGIGGKRSMTKKELRENLKEVEELATQTKYAADDIGHLIGTGSQYLFEVLNELQNAEISAKEAYEKLENDGELEGLESD